MSQLGGHSPLTFDLYLNMELYPLKQVSGYLYAHQSASFDDTLRFVRNQFPGFIEIPGALEKLGGVYLAARGAFEAKPN